MTRLRSLLFPALVLALAYAGWRSYGLPGLLLALLMASFWALVSFTRMMRLLREASARPLGAVADARALQAALRPGQPMHEVIRRAACLGQREGGDEAQGEDVFVWRDPQGARVRARFRSGRLQQAVWLAPEAPQEPPSQT